MAWRFHAIDATLCVEVHEGFRNISQDNLAHWVISTQVRTDEDIAAFLRKWPSDLETVLAVNKCESPEREPEMVAEFWPLGSDPASLRPRCEPGSRDPYASLFVRLAAMVCGWGRRRPHVIDAASCACV